MSQVRVNRQRINLTFDHNHRTQQPAMRRSPRPDAPPMGTTSSRPKSVTCTDKDSMPLDSKATAIQPPPRKRLRTENGGGEAASASNLHATVSALLELPLDVLLEVRSSHNPTSPLELTLLLADPHPRRPHVPPPRITDVAGPARHPHGPSLELDLAGELRQHGPWTAPRPKRPNRATIPQSPRRPVL